MIVGEEPPLMTGSPKKKGRKQAQLAQRLQYSTDDMREAVDTSR